jgi:hypothetical protein
MLARQVLKYLRHAPALKEKIWTKISVFKNIKKFEAIFHCTRNKAFNCANTKVFHVSWVSENQLPLKCKNLYFSIPI